MLRNVLPMLMVAVFVGCAPKATPARTEAVSVPGPGSATEGPVSSPRAPMTVEWVFQGEAAGRLTLIARVNRTTALQVPTSVTVTVPPGLRVLSGRTLWVIEGSESTVPVEETLVFEVSQPGPQEILLAADAVGVGFGVHAKKVYKLGQAAQKAAAPPSPGPKLEVGGRDFGPSVPAKP
jgi:hypothetical protein